MGPRFFNRGNFANGRKLVSRSRIFNGAAVFQPRKYRVSADRVARTPPLQWGRGFSTAEMPRRTDVLNRNKSLQWGRGFSTAEIGQTPIPHKGFRTSSMGPRFFNRGNPNALTGTQVHIVSSMGPRFFNRGNDAFSVIGHWLSRSSMGPRFFNRGNQVLNNRWFGAEQSSMGPRFFNRGNHDVSV